MIDWLAMDGDGIYVWPCYVLTLTVLVVNLWVARTHHRSLLQRVTLRARGKAAGADRMDGAKAGSSNTRQSTSEEAPQ